MNVEYKQYNESKYILINDKLLTSKYNPMREKNRLLEAINYDIRNTTYIIFGIGMGYYVKDLLCEIDETNKILIFEPSSEIFTKFKESCFFLEHERINYIVEKQENILKDTIFIKNNNRHKLVYSYANYRNLFKTDYYKLLEVVRNDSLRILTNEITINHFNEQFTVNAIENYYLNTFDASISQFKDGFRDIPALIVSSGPSLEKNKHLINEFNGIVFSGGRTIKNFLEENIKFDICVSVDPGENAFKLIKDVLQNNMSIPLITYLESNSKVVDSYRGPKVLMQSSNMPLIEEHLKNISIIENGPSVANVTVALAEYLGCSPIVFIGQDLAYTNKKHHADSTISSFDTINDVNGQYEIDGYYGGKVKTTNQFLSMLHWFNKWIDKSDTVFYNCTEGGAKISGCEQISFEKYLENQSVIQYGINEKIDKMIKNYKYEINGGDIYEFSQTLNKLLKVVKYAIDLVIDLKMSNEISRTRYLLKKLDKQDSIMTEVIHNSSIFNYLFADAMIQYRCEKTFNVANYKMKIIESNLKFYGSLYEKFKRLDKIIGEFENGKSK